MGEAREERDTKRYQREVRTEAGCELKWAVGSVGMGAEGMGSVGMGSVGM